MFVIVKREVLKQHPDEPGKEHVSYYEGTFESLLGSGPCFGSRKDGRDVCQFETREAAERTARTLRRGKITIEPA
jgi:hypothetical protein